jgi:hypothetical protein
VSSRPLLPSLGTLHGEVPAIVPIVDLPAFGCLVQELSCRAWALAFVGTFTSMLESRIERIGTALNRLDEEEGRVAMLSLMASAAMVGAARLHAVVDAALTAPFSHVDSDTVVKVLHLEAHRFRDAFKALAT